MRWSFGGYTAALTPVTAPGLWADAQLGAAGGGLADLEAHVQRITPVHSRLYQNVPHTNFSILFKNLRLKFANTTLTLLAARARVNHAA